MPKRADIHKIMIIGAGPIIIGQACEFDYSGSQACKALREEGYEVVLVNSNPATIMTDPEMANRTYIEPVTPEIVAKIIEKERPDALLPTLGGQTGLNTAVAVAEQGILEKFNVEMIGANLEAIKRAEDRQQFKDAMQKAKIDLPKSGCARNWKEAKEILKTVGLPAIIRPSFTLGGTGSGVAKTPEEYEKIVKYGQELSPTHEVLIEEDLTGWKEFELEVMRDKNDNVVIICSIENFDAMGIHTGDSITVAPAQTLTDKEYQAMRDASIRCIRAIGVETGGSNIQYAVNPKDGRMVIIEMNPRVSRSSALASKATGFPIAKFAAKLSVGYTLDEIQNDITKETPASFEPSIDYCVIKIPRFTFEKFKDADAVLNTSMKSVGETMAIGRTFKEALQKGLRSLEVGRFGLGNDGKSFIEPEKLVEHLKIPNDRRIFYIKYAIEQGMSTEELYRLTHVDPWFLENMKQILEAPKQEKSLFEMKRLGFSDRQIAYLQGTTEEKVKQLRQEQKVKPVYKLVDTCAAEFPAFTPYYYSTYETECESKPSKKKKVMILGGGPNRIGQGIEFDYCCCHASFALREEGYESIMVNSNPETVSTDYDTSDKLYFEPLTKEDVVHIIEKEKPDGIIVQFGGQTPLNLALPIQKSGGKIIGTSPKSIDRAEDRKLFQRLLKKLKLKQPSNGTAKFFEQAKKVAKKIGYPVLVRPSYVLGGRAMEIVYDDSSLEQFMRWAVDVSPEHPILIDKFLEDAIEIDVDAVSDGRKTVVCGIMEHIEEAGIHSGDSACVIPSFSLSDEMIEEIKQATYALAKELKVKGLMNIQYAVQGDTLYVLEVNPRASRTIPYVSKVTGIPWAKVATKVMIGKTLKQQGIEKEIEVEHVAVKEAVFPFNRFPGADAILGPEMKSTGEVMGLDKDFGLAYAKSQIASANSLPIKGLAFISLKNSHKEEGVDLAKQLLKLNFTLSATEGTANFIRKHGMKCKKINKVSGGSPHIVDILNSKKIALVVNTGGGKSEHRLNDAIALRRATLINKVPYCTNMSTAQACLKGIKSLKTKAITVTSLQNI